MTLSIRWKLVLAALVPLIVGLSINLTINYRRFAEKAIEQSQAVILQAASLQASRFETRLERVAEAARSIAGYLSEGPDLDPERTRSLLSAMIERDPLIFGTTAAFEPGVMAGKDRFAPYFFRADGGIAEKDLAAAYDYTDGSHEWYSVPRSAIDSHWTEPYFDHGGGEVMMSTYSAPIIRDGRFVGVVTADIKLDTLQQALEPVQLPGYRGFGLLSKNGLIIALDNPDLIGKLTLLELADAIDCEELRVLAREMLAGRRGIMLCSTMPGDPPQYIAYVPIRQTGWSYGAAIDRALILDPVYRELRDRGIFTVIIVSAVAVIILLLSFRLTRPVPILAGAMEALGKGDMNARADITTHDELRALGDGFNAMTAQLRKQIEEIKQQTAAREAVESDLRVARGIQESLLPRTFPPFPEHPEFELHAANLPARHVAGDFFDFLFVSPDELLMIIADVSGKGVPASMLMAVTRTLVRNVGLGGIGPAGVLTRVNDALSRDNESGLFVTAWVGMYAPSTGSLRWSSAGHPPPMLVSSGAEPRALEGDTGLVLGIVEGTDYAESTLELRKGDSILAYTDGVSEAKAPDGELFGDARIRDLLATANGDGARALCDRVIAEIERYQQHNLADDVTVLALRRSE